MYNSCVLFPRKSCIWTNIFNDWSQAESFLKENRLISDKFSSEIWMKTQLLFFQQSKRGLMPRFSTLPNFVNSKPNSRVIDFGGGSGWIGNFLPETCFYLNQETTSSLQYFKGMNKSYNRIITKNAEAYVSSIDILYSNSVIQYLPNVDIYIDLIHRFKPKYIVLDDVQLSNKIDFITLQRYYGSYIISRFYNLNNLINSIIYCKYELVSSELYPVVVSRKMKHKIENRSHFDPNLTQPRSLVLKRLPE